MLHEEWVEYLIVMLIGRPGRSASRQPGQFRPGPADGWPARPADGKFANFKINQLLTQF